MLAERKIMPEESGAYHWAEGYFIGSKSNERIYLPRWDTWNRGPSLRFKVFNIVL